jgi:hypothetical protein
MRLPHELSGADLIRRLARLGYRPTGQTGGHVRLTAGGDSGPVHHLTLPNHDPLRLDTLASVLADVAGHGQLTRDELLKRLFG